MRGTLLSSVSLSRVGVFLYIGAFFASPAWGAFVCADEKYYPAVQKLERTDRGLRALLGGKFLKLDEKGFPIKRPMLTYSDSEGWKQDKAHSCGKGDFNCLPPKHPAKIDTPPIMLSTEEAIALRPSLKNADTIVQNVSAWTEDGGFIWFGLSFYAGEGSDGVGGVGRYDPKTKQTEVRRPKVLLDSSINHIAHDGQSLWLGTTGYYECIGEPPLHGLVRYEWDTDRIETYEGTEDGPCGFVVHDLLLEKNHLWVATELGLSRWDRRSKKWEHYISDPTASEPMRATTCAVLYRGLLNTLPRTPTSGAEDFGSYYAQLFQALAHFRPQFLNAYVSGMSPDHMKCEEVTFLAQGMPDFATLKTKLLTVHQVGGPNFWCVIKGFGGKQSRDPGWRDVLVKALGRFDDGQHYERQEVLYPLLENFPGDAQIGELLAHRLKTAQNPWYEAQLLPIFLGKKSVPPLIEALDRFKDSTHVLNDVIKALVRATGLYITPDGKAHRLPPNADPGKYVGREASQPRVASQWKKWWELHKAEYGAGPVRPEPNRPEKGARADTAMPFEPQITLSSPASTLPIGTVYTLKGAIKNLADPNSPLIPNLPLSLQVREGPHAEVMERLRGATDSKGNFTFSYSGTKSGKDGIEVAYEGEEFFIEPEYAEVTWGGPDLVVPLFIPPMLRSAGGNKFFVTDWTENIGSFQAAPSTTRYYLSATTPVNPAKAHVVGERTVPALAPGERSDVKQLQLTLPSDLPSGIYYLAACADAAGTVLETDEQNNCSFSKLPGQAVIIMPALPLQKSPE